MDDNSEDSSIYNLITSLCEKFTNDQTVVRKLRSRAYEILLKKRSNAAPSSRLKGPDPYCSLLAWQFTLVTQYGLEQQGLDLKEFGDYVSEIYGDEIIEFLLCFRNVPKDDNEVLEFELPSFFTSSTTLQSESQKTDFVNSEFEEDEEDIWDVASRQSFSSRRNWESFGYCEPDKEKPFLSELGLNSHLWVQSLPSLHKQQLEVKQVRDFIKDIKYLLVGMASNFFTYNEIGDFVLNSSLTVQGLTPSTLQKYSEELIFCGSCYKALNENTTTNLQTGKYKQEGYIFTELCQSIQRYLEYYRTAVMNLPDSIGLLKLDESTNQLRNQIKTLAEICKLGPYSNSGDMPHGVALLNYLYQTVLGHWDSNILLVLYSILFPCCQVYLSRFLEQWLLYGNITDPFEEFFIKSNSKYVATRGRTYWTRSYSLRKEIVPDFLADLREEILSCGKSMNLLKLCVPSNTLCLYLMEKKPLIISCCLTSEQLVSLEQNATNYYFGVLSECGSILKLEQVIKKDKEQDPIFMNLIAKKRAATLKRIELERKKILAEEREKKLDEITALKEQYDSALRLKESRIAAEIETEIKQIEFNLSMENVRDKLIEKEAKEMIDYYNKLYEISDRRRKHVENYAEKLKTLAVGSTSSQETFYSVEEEQEEEEDKFEEVQSIHSSQSLDRINANESIETFAMAKKIKEKVLSEEMEMIIPPSKTEPIKTVKNTNLTEAQRNKLKVMSSEFGIELKPTITIKKSLTQCEINRNVVMGTSDCLNLPKLDNLNFCNRNEVIEPDKKIKKSVSLSLDFGKTEVVPMSVDSTPLSESTNSRAAMSLERESLPTTAETQTDEGFNFEGVPESVYVPLKRNFSDCSQNKVFSKRVTTEEASGLITNCLNIFMYEGIATCLATQKKLVKNELLKFFVQDLKYFAHLKSLGDYFFLQDGEFGRNITENLFEKLYDVHFPIELINGGTLKNLVIEALEMSKFQENSTYLSFKINSLPKRFHLGDPDVLDCLSLTYKVTWPLNILLPVDTIGKYDEVFKYLLKLNRISWVLKKIFLELKILAKVSGKKEIYLMMSPHYRRLHQCRHVMMHFIQTLQNYIVGEVLQSKWEIFERKLSEVTDLDSLYSAHTTYIKSILFSCLLSQRWISLRKVIHKIFVVILKFYDYLRSRNWKCENGVYIHPNFAKLESIFNNFEEFVLHLFKIGKKVTKSGYQPHLAQLFDMLDVNGYYSKKNDVSVQ